MRAVTTYDVVAACVSLVSNLSPRCCAADHGSRAQHSTDRETWRLTRKCLPSPAGLYTRYINKVYILLRFSADEAKDLIQRYLTGKGLAQEILRRQNDPER